MVTDVEVSDWVLQPGADELVYRRQNEAANAELLRRQGGGVDLEDPWVGGALQPSGEVPPDEIVYLPMTMGDDLWWAIVIGNAPPQPL